MKKTEGYFFLENPFCELRLLRCSYEGKCSPIWTSIYILIRFQYFLIKFLFYIIVVFSYIFLHLGPLWALWDPWPLGFGSAAWLALPWLGWVGLALQSALLCLASAANKPHKGGGLRPPPQRRAGAFGARPPLWIPLWGLLAAEARQSKADCKARPTQPSQGKASQAAEPNQRKQMTHSTIFQYEQDP